MDKTIPHYDVTIGNQDAEADIQNIVSKIRPEWPTDSLKIKVFDGGLTNRIFGVYYDDQDEMLLVRVFGEYLYINRKMERKSMELLHSHNLAQQLYCSFENGLCYGYVPGTIFDLNIMVHDVFYACLVAKEIAKYHTLPIPEDYSPGQTRGSFFASFDTMLTLLPEKFENTDDNLRYEEYGLTADQLKQEVAVLEKVAQGFQDILVVCHLNLLPENIILSHDGHTVRFIDYEFCGLSHRQQDIATFFLSHMNISNPNPDLYPSKEHQFIFLKTYLNEVYKLENRSDTVFDSDVEKLYSQVQKMTLMAYLYWGLCCVVQSVTATIPFDFLGLGTFLMKEYVRLKDEYLAL